MTQHQANPPKGWHTRGYLPHFDGEHVPQFITFRLAGSIPAELIAKWRRTLSAFPKTEAEYELRERIEEYIDREAGPAILLNPSIALQVENAILHFDGVRYYLHAWVVMPNHVHLLVTPIEGHGIPAILHSLKSFTAKEANALLGRSGAFWQKDYFDRYMRNIRHYQNTIEYIEMNPVKAGLCKSPEQWRYGGAWKGRKRGNAGETPALPV